ncbi:phage major capsid protein [Kribbella solani]|uniref:phage major capsid protein n=1 Tax=Kribbella solani TaxID=236067 RepID=UPI0029ADEEFE|nr:phage major capsid protein [Kribbella solani]MDX3006733.1 phage major capsid protein [Kribbella solani]
MKPDKLLALADRGRKMVRRPENRGDWFRVANADGERAELFIYGAIGDYWGEDDVTAAAFTRALRGITAAALDLHINSPGGLVFDGVAIYSALRNHAATVDVHVDGVAASAASFIAMAGDTITIEKPAKMMIHDAGGIVVGNAGDMREMADLLDELSDTIAGIYADRAGGTVESWREAMKTETWYSSADAVTAGLADRVANDTPAAVAVLASAAAPRTVAPVVATAQSTTPVTARGSHKEGTKVEIEEIMAALKAIIDGAEGRTLTDEEVKRYEALEVDLAQKRTEKIRNRQVAYETPVRDSIQAAVHVAPPKQDDGLEKAFEAYLRTGQANADIADLRVTNAQGAASDPAGGYTVPQGFRQKLVDVMKAYGGLAEAVESFPTDTGNLIEYPTLDDTATSGTITAEGAAITGGADMTFGTVNLGAFKYTSAGASNAPLKVSVELLQDSAFDIAGLVAGKLGTRIARKQATDWVTGAGTTLPFGIARSGLTADVTLAAGNPITYQKLLDIETALDPAYEQNASWAMSKATWQNIRAVVGSDGRPLVQESAQAGIGGRPQRMLLGYPVIIDQAFPSNTTLSAKFAVLGDLKEAYVIRRVSNLVVVVNPYSSANSGQVEYVAWERADGNVQNRKAYSLAAANAT